MMNNLIYSDLLLLARAYIDNPSTENQTALYYFVKQLSLGQPSRQTRLRILRLRLFLFAIDSNRAAKVKFKSFAAREYLIRFTRPSSPHSGLDSRRCRVGPLNSAATSTARLTFSGSY